MYFEMEDVEPDGLGMMIGDTDGSPDSGPLEIMLWTDTITERCGEDARVKIAIADLLSDYLLEEETSPPTERALAILNNFRKELDDLELRLKSKSQAVSP